jgi:predicted phosphodiesterase
MEKADLILCSDLHIRETQPVCRLDDFVNKTQWEDLQFLKDLQKEHDCPVVCGGDVYHYWKPSPWLITKTLQHIPDNFCTVYGQHDLPNHSYTLKDKAGLTTLSENPKVELLSGLHWGQNEEPKNFDFSVSDGSINFLAMHKFAWDGKNVPWPGCNELTAEQILDKYPDYDLIVTGDHHKGFTFKKDGRLLVNPGCFNIQDGKYLNYKPRVYLWYRQKNEVVPVYIPVNREHITRQHIEEKEAREQKLEELVQGVKKGWQEYFGEYIDEPEEVLKEYFRRNKTDNNLQQIIFKAVER